MIGHRDSGTQEQWEISTVGHRDNGTQGQWKTEKVGQTIKLCMYDSFWVISALKF